MRRLSALFALLVLAQSARADWKVASHETTASPVAEVEHRRVRVQSSAEEATIDIALFSTKRATLRVVDNASAQRSLAEAMSQCTCVAGVNGGYFDPEFRPLGLRVLNGKTTSALTHAHLLTGVLCGSQAGVRILRTAEFSRQLKLQNALQCGPLLIDGGAAVRNLERTRSARRTFAAVSRSDTAAIGVTSAFTLAELAEALVALSPDLNIWRAMNLDGGSSSAFWFRQNGNGAVSIPEEKSVRDFVAIVPR